jgi:hypothetical protein
MLNLMTAMNAQGGAMSSVGWAILMVGLALAAEVAWAEFRAWQARQSALRRAPAIHAKAPLLIRARQAKDVFRQIRQDQIR